MTSKEREAVEKRFLKCCGKRPSVAFWNRQKDKQGIAYDENIGVNVRCRKCGAELYIRKVSETDDELEPLIDIAVEQWNVEKAMVLPYFIETNRKESEVRNG